MGTARVAKAIKVKVHMPKKVTAAFRAKVKKACKFCKENINIVKGNKKLIVIKSHKTIKAKKVHRKKRHHKAKKIHIKKIHAMKKKKKVSHFKRLLKKVKRVHKRLITRAATLVISIHTTIVTTMRRIKVSSPKVKIILTKKVKKLQIKAKKAQK